MNIASVEEDTSTFFVCVSSLNDILYALCCACENAWILYTFLGVSPSGGEK